MESEDLREIALEKAKNHHGEIELIDSLTKEGSAYYQGFLDGFDKCFEYWGVRNNVISSLIVEKLGYHSTREFFEEVEKRINKQGRRNSIKVVK